VFLSELSGGLAPQLRVVSQRLDDAATGVAAHPQDGIDEVDSGLPAAVVVEQGDEIVKVSSPSRQPRNAGRAPARRSRPTRRPSAPEESLQLA